MTESINVPPAAKPQSSAASRALSLSLFALAVVGALAGAFVFFLHATNDPLTDVHAYFDAGARLNAGLPLYVQPAGIDDAAFYRYPPLLAILFRPLALLPFEVAAAIWEVAIILSLLATIWLLGPRRQATWLAIGILALPIGWCLAIGQAQAVLTLFSAIGTPWSVALASNLKLFPALIALWWIGQRDWRRLGWFFGWMAILAVVQFILAPQASLDYLSAMNLGQVGSASALRNISPYAVSPLLWALLVLAGGLLVLVLARTRFGWAAAATFAVVANPRLLVYALMALLAAVAKPGRRDPHA